MRFRVLATSWAADDVAYEGGDYEVDSTPELLRCLGAALAVDGLVEILDATSAERAAMRGAVEPDGASVRAQTKAIRSGAWREGHLLDVVARHDAIATDRRRTKDERAAARAIARAAVRELGETS